MGNRSNQFLARGIEYPALQSMALANREQAVDGLPRIV
jgi:hypothetical protein